jgi:hypothetical protein
MSRWRQIVACVLLLIVAVAAQPRERAARVSLELFTDTGFGVDDSHRWYQLLTQLGVANLQIRGETPGDEIGVHTVGKRDAPTYEVIGRLTANNVLQLPGGKFTLSDSVRLKQWLKNLSEEGTDGIIGQRERFGLTAVQLQEVQEDLKRPVGFPTAGLPTTEVLAKIVGGLRHQVDMATGSSEALAKRKVAEDLQTISSGTALAVILRPAGLVLTPEHESGKTTRLRIGAPVAGREAWPAGWTSDKPDRELLPDLFKFVHVEIDETPLSEAIQRIQPRLRVPFLWDWYSLEAQGEDPARIQVKLGTKRLSYGMILQKILSQGKLQRELRVDDTGAPFLWITTLKPATLGSGS